jgi:nicotinamidase-related amidase
MLAASVRGLQPRLRSGRLFSGSDTREVNDQGRLDQLSGKVKVRRQQTMLTAHNAMLMIVDVQGNLAHAMHEKQFLFTNLEKIIKGAQILGLPILLTEQIPAKLGATLPEIATLMPEVQPLSKSSFSCWGEEQMRQKVVCSGREQILIAGIEAHVCVYQTAVDLLEHGYEVHIVADAISSRTAPNRETGLRRMHEQGAKLTSTEMALFELLKVAEGPAFKEIIKIVK